MTLGILAIVAYQNTPLFLSYEKFLKKRKKQWRVEGHLCTKVQC